ncbi:hypothetical protein [Neisseria meningitidis]|nr:hypothetical protein [Neisseria meningitidis]
MPSETVSDGIFMINKNQDKATAKIRTRRRSLRQYRIVKNRFTWCIAP